MYRKFLALKSYTYYKLKHTPSNPSGTIFYKINSRHVFYPAVPSAGKKSRSLGQIPLVKKPATSKQIKEYSGVEEFPTTFLFFLLSTSLHHCNIPLVTAAKPTSNKSLLSPNIIMATKKSTNNDSTNQNGSPNKSATAQNSLTTAHLKAKKDTVSFGLYFSFFCIFNSIFF